MKRQNAAIDPPFCAEATRLKKPRFCFCLDYYLDLYCGCTPAHESEIFALLRELLLTERSQAIRDDILQLLGDYRGRFWRAANKNKHRAT